MANPQDTLVLIDDDLNDFDDDSGEVVQVLELHFGPVGEDDALDEIDDNPLEPGDYDEDVEEDDAYDDEEE